ncbi:MAG: 1-(5-phosphoribosyl)-5-((5-phosphoribosylamino)methylideneamino)imidazole-4-carboxamide isomerase, partial [Ruminococcaceae bacterium]|nr:1-(5-phosphoribosyl)-5-((5-phosphoribosylamino)methylideneamino)imidazole-4-carboxamide isomerase [Oscillospiraceae bacterium]
EIVDLYAGIGVDRIILGTAALTDPEFLKKAVSRYGERIAVGVDIKDGMVAIKGWTEISNVSCDDFCRQLEDIGVGTVICTDISKDGMMSGTNLELYRGLCEKFKIKIVASGGVSTLGDVRALTKMNVYGAILGKALYTGAIDLGEAVKLTEEKI